MDVEFTPESMIPVIAWGLSLLALLLFTALAIMTSRLSKTMRGFNEKLEDIHRSLSNGKDNIGERIEECRIESARLDSCNREDWQREVSILSDRVTQLDSASSEGLDAAITEIRNLLTKSHSELTERLNDISDKSSQELLAVNERTAVQEDHISKLEQTISEIEKTIHESQQGSFGEIEGLKRQLEAHKEETAARVEKLSDYLHEIFEKELRGVFRSFDSVITSVLDQMKGELLRGVNQIEDLQSVVSSRETAESLIVKNERTLNELLVEPQQVEPKHGGPDGLAEIGKSEDTLQVGDGKSGTNDKDVAEMDEKNENVLVEGIEIPSPQDDQAAEMPEPSLGAEEAENYTISSANPHPAAKPPSTNGKSKLPPNTAANLGEILEPTGESNPPSAPSTLGSVSSESENDAETHEANANTEIEDDDYQLQTTPTNTASIELDSDLSEQGRPPNDTSASSLDKPVETDDQGASKENEDEDTETKSSSPQAKKSKKKPSWLADALYRDVSKNNGV